MNRSCHAITLVCRCRKTFRSSLPARTCSFNQFLAVPNHRRFFATGMNNCSIKDTFPKLPIESPPMFAIDVTQRLFKQVAWSVQNELDKDLLLSTNAAAEKILMFVTECLANSEFEVLEEKLSPEALEKARTIALSESNDKCLIFEGTSKQIFFAAQNRFFTPWVFSANNNCLTLTYLALMSSKSQQSIWGITLDIPKDRDGNLSEDLKVTDFYFQTHLL